MQVGTDLLDIGSMHMVHQTYGMGVWEALCLQALPRLIHVFHRGRNVLMRTAGIKQARIGFLDGTPFPAQQVALRGDLCTKVQTVASLRLVAGQVDCHHCVQEGGLCRCLEFFEGEVDDRSNIFACPEIRIERHLQGAQHEGHLHIVPPVALQECQHLGDDGFLISLGWVGNDIWPAVQNPFLRCHQTGQFGQNQRREPARGIQGKIKVHSMLPPLPQASDHP